MRIVITTKQGALVEEWSDKELSSYDFEDETDYMEFASDMVDAIARGWVIEGNIEAYEQEDSKSRLERMCREAREDEHLVRGEE